MRIIFVLLLCTTGIAGCVVADQPALDTRPFTEAECEKIVSKDLGHIEYCQRGDYAEIIRVGDDLPLE